jgi:peptide/nickel transport system substrate-binding protein
MKNWRKILALVLVLAMAVSLVACSGSSTTSTASSTASTASKSESSAASSKAESSAAASSAASSEAASTEGTTDRNETLYYDGLQWGKANDMNPMSTNSNDFAVDQSAAARELIYETPYMYNVLDGKLYPLLADGDYSWNSDQTELTFKIKKAAKWSDGTAVTANDFAYTFDTHVKYQTNTGVDYSQYIESITAKDDSTVVIKAKKDNLNPLKVIEYLPKIYVMQKAYIQSLETKYSNDADKMKTDTMWDAPHTGPYGMYYNSDQKVVFVRDDNYWGQDASMFGSLPAPKYIAHNVFSSNAAGDAALAAGEVDVSQQYTANVQKLWEEQNLPISTYYSDSPYHLSGTFPSAYFNMSKPGLDQVAVRQAIAYAVDYDQIRTNAMTNQSPTFTDYPRCLFNASPAERNTDLYKNIASSFADLTWTGKDYTKANKVLDDAGIKDTNGDGIREYNGTSLEFKVECPKGWSDWNAALDLVADCGQYIGMKIETYYPESSQWTDDIQTGNFDIIMSSPDAFSISCPWTRAYDLMYGFGGNFPTRMTFNYGRYYNADVDKILSEIPTTTDEKKLEEYWTSLNKAYLSDVPSFALMYRPQWFCTYNESVWTGFPEDGDGTNIPPAICCQGYGIEALYKIHLVSE